MKKFLFAVLLFGLVGSVNTYAQRMTRSQLKDQKEFEETKREDLVDAKASKTARKQAKQLKKEGWKTTGAQSLEKQVDQYLLMQADKDQSGEPFYFWGETNSTGTVYDAIKMNAMEIANQQISKQLGAEVAALVKSTTGNKQLGAEELASIVDIVESSQSLIQHNLGRTTVVLEYYRELSNGKKEIHLATAYSRQEALEVAKKVIQKSLEEKGDDLSKKLDSILGW